MRILITGSRDWTDEAAIELALRSVIENSTDPVENHTLVHGACPTGADAIADRIWVRWGFSEPERHPAEWRVYGKSAGFKRNEKMVNLGADLCLAFIGPCVKEGCSKPGDHGSHGATSTHDLARQAGIDTRRITILAA